MKQTTDLLTGSSPFSSSSVLPSSSVDSSSSSSGPLGETRGEVEERTLRRVTPERSRRACFDKSSFEHPWGSSPWEGLRRVMFNDCNRLLFAGKLYSLWSNNEPNFPSLRSFAFDCIGLRTLLFLASSSPPWTGTRFGRGGGVLGSSRLSPGSLSLPSCFERGGGVLARSLLSLGSLLLPSTKVRFERGGRVLVRPLLSLLPPSPKLRFGRGGGVLARRLWGRPCAKVEFTISWEDGRSSPCLCDCSTASLFCTS